MSRRFVLSMFILALATIGCERGDLRDSAPEPETPPSTEQTDSLFDEPLTPDQPNSVQQRIAALLAGHWRGELTSEYIDEKGVTHTASCTSDLRLELFEAGAVNGKGKETDYNGEKQVYMMPFNWYVDVDGHLHMKFADNRLMASTALEVDETQLICRLRSSDTMEINEFKLIKVKE